MDNDGNHVDAVIEGTKVFLKIDVQSGYKVNGAFNGKGELVPLQQDDQGNYYIEVERGGGVFLSVSVEKIRALAEGGVKMPAIVIYRDDGSVEAKFYTQKDGVKLEKAGEPDAAAMSILSAGLDDACVHKASYAFTDTLENHGKLQITFVLPGYEGKLVTIATIVNGEQVLYKDLRVANDGTVSITVDHLGDFAVFLA